MANIVRHAALTVMSLVCLLAAFEPLRITERAIAASPGSVFQATLWRVDLLEANGQSAGGFENENVDRCLRQAKAWVEGEKGRTYRGPYKVKR